LVKSEIYKEFEQVFQFNYLSLLILRDLKEERVCNMEIKLIVQNLAKIKQ